MTSSSHIKIHNLFLHGVRPVVQLFQKTFHLLWAGNVASGLGRYYDEWSIFRWWVAGMMVSVVYFMVLLVVFMAGFATCLKSVFFQITQAPTTNPKPETLNARIQTLHPHVQQEFCILQNLQQTVTKVLRMQDQSNRYVMRLWCNEAWCVPSGNWWPLEVAQI